MNAKYKIHLLKRKTTYSFLKKRPTNVSQHWLFIIPYERPCVQPPAAFEMSSKETNCFEHEWVDFSRYLYQYQISAKYLKPTLLETGRKKLDSDKLSNL